MDNKLYPAEQFKQVTPNDGADLVDGLGGAIRTRGISLAVAGNLAVFDKHGNTQVLLNLAAGVIHPIATRRIKATSTTATGICVYW
jgi:hypothetical protein